MPQYFTAMHKVDRRREGQQFAYYLDDRRLEDGDILELRLGGDAGWVQVTVEGLPGALKIRWDAEGGRTMHTSLPLEATVRWA